MIYNGSTIYNEGAGSGGGGSSVDIIKYKNSNPYGFDAKLVGDYNGTFENLNNYGNFWTKTEVDSSNAYDVQFATNISLSSKSKLNGYSLRLVKDAP